MKCFYLRGAIFTSPEVRLKRVFFCSVRNQERVPAAHSHIFLRCGSWWAVIEARAGHGQVVVLMFSVPCWSSPSRLSSWVESLENF